MESSLERLVASLKALPGVRRISVGGSYARGRRDLRTDLDVLVVMDSDEPFIQRTARLYQRSPLPVDLDLAYPNSLPDSIPSRVFPAGVAGDAVALAEEVVRLVEARLAG